MSMDINKYTHYERDCPARSSALQVVPDCGFRKVDHVHVLLSGSFDTCCQFLTVHRPTLFDFFKVYWHFPTAGDIFVGTVGSN